MAGREEAQDMGSSPGPSTPRSPPADQSELLSAEEVVARRGGDVLLRHTILKSDHFPGCQNMRLRPLVDGAPNYRQVEGLPVYGVAIPTVAGLRRMLDLMGAAKHRRRVLWHSMREEPVIYINGAPFVVREADKPFANLEYTGIDRERVEAMEARLKLDVLHEAATYGNQILVAEEDDNFQVVQTWQPVTEADVQTPAEVYHELEEDGYDVDYLRVPVTDEKAPKSRDFDTLIRRCWSTPKGAALVFNCQMGRGRTTTGMTIGTLLTLRAAMVKYNNGSDVTTDAVPSSFWEGLPAKVVLDASGEPIFPPWFVATSQENDKDELSAAAELELNNGYWSAVRSLLRVLEGGLSSKKVLDCVLDACSAMQNLRTATLSYRDRVAMERNDSRRGAVLSVALEYLERYYMLIAFATYVGAPGFDPGADDHPGFALWTGARDELASILDRMLRMNPLAALELGGDREDKGFVGSDNALPPSSPMSREEEEIAAHRASRCGAVLGPRTILKQDHFSGCQSERLPVLVSGAPNLRELKGVRVWGGAIPTAEGLRGILDLVGAGPGSFSFGPGRRDDESPAAPGALWTLMREEPVVYVNGEPFVLREASRPFKNLMEYRGIAHARLESMEERLAADVTAEAAAHNGLLLVTREWETAEGPSGRRSLRDGFISVKEVATPRQVADRLVRRGYRIKLVRIPVTDGRAPRTADFDAFYAGAAAANPADALIYTCQLGGGRTTMGMAIGALLRQSINGFALGADWYGQNAENLDEDVGPDDAGALLPWERTAGGQGGGVKGVKDSAPAYRSAFSNDEVGEDIGRRIDTDDGADGQRQEHDGEEEGTTARHTSGPVHDPSASPFRETHGAPVLRVALDRQRAGSFLSAAPSTLPEGTVWDQEAANLWSGEYVAVRRLCRVLDRGDAAKSTVDAVVDAAGTLINLRTTIMRYRRPKSLDKFFRPEIQARHAAFARGSAYLERYCLLITFAAYLAECRERGRRASFAEWWAARPDVRAARDFVHSNPASALAPVPGVLPATPAPAARRTSSSSNKDATNDDIVVLPGQNRLNSVETIIRPGGPGPVSSAEQKAVLVRRHGRIVGRRTILKSMPATINGVSSSAADLALTPQQRELLASLRAAGVPDSRAVAGWPIITVGSASVVGLRRVLKALGAGEGTRVVVTDLREELALYIAGELYVRRELEAPATAAHHAGVQGAKLEALERRLRSDVAAEAAAWGGWVLLHREVVRNGSSGSLAACVAKKSKRDVLMLSKDGALPEAKRPRLDHDSAGQLKATATEVQGDTFLDGRPDQPLPQVSFAERLEQTANDHEIEEDITRSTQYEAKTRVEPFWARAGSPGDVDEGLATPAEVFATLAAEGADVRYRRVPLSRERTPAAADLDLLAGQLVAGKQHPKRRGVERVPGSTASVTTTTLSHQRLAAQRPPSPTDKPTVYVFIGRTASGSSQRFAAAFGAAVLARQRHEEESANVDDRLTPMGSSPRGEPSLLLLGSSRLVRVDSEVSELARNVTLGEYRGIMNLCRVLRAGADAKEAVDAAIDASRCIGDVRLDIVSCRSASAAATDDEGATGDVLHLRASAARRLGLHYLQRYFLMIAYMGYMEAVAPPRDVSFAHWMAERRETKYLLSTLELE